MEKIADEPMKEPKRVIYTVSELTSKIKLLLEDSFPFIWITGEISNFRVPASGHFYFTLKDENAQINALMFKGMNRNLRFKPEDGMSVIGLGRISLYEPRGTYQIILEYLEPKGIGALQVAFERLKQKLFKEGLFDEKFKKPLPFLPHKISVITSPTGAVAHDFIRVASRRFENIPIQIISTKVQGEGAEAQIVDAIELANLRNDSDIAILARGGGSLEDLHAFNSESVARAIFASGIPIVSAVGHETDYTIADFVADLRAPTPSAAAELTVPKKSDLKLRVEESKFSLTRSILQHTGVSRTAVENLKKRLINPRKRLADLILHIDDNTSRLIRAFLSMIELEKERLGWKMDSLIAKSPVHKIQNYNDKLDMFKNNILKSLDFILNKSKHKFQELTSRLHDLSPLAVLDRGYSIARTIPMREIIRDPDQVSERDRMEVIVAKGNIICIVERK